LAAMEAGLSQPQIQELWRWFSASMVGLCRRGSGVEDGVGRGRPDLGGASSSFGGLSSSEGVLRAGFMLLLLLWGACASTFTVLYYELYGTMSCMVL
jgi:hypothetical protein